MSPPAKQRAERMARRLPTTHHCAAARGAEGAAHRPYPVLFFLPFQRLIIAAVEACARNDLSSHKNPTELREPNRVGILLIEYVRASDLQVRERIWDQARPEFAGAWFYSRRVQMHAEKEKRNRGACWNSRKREHQINA